MPTPVPALDRAMLIINHLAAQPGEALPLSRIAEETGIHKATTAALLANLVKHGLVRRTDRKLYLLGPEYVRLNHAYTTRHPGYHRARIEMVRLTDALGLSCSLAVVDGDDYVIVDIVGDLLPTHLPTRLGRRMPLAPPLGSIFKVWGSPDEVNAWITRMAEEFGTDREAQLATISAIRTRGYALGSEQDFDVRLDAALRRLSRDDSDVRGLTVAMMVADKIRNYDGQEPTTDNEPVNYIVGPIFGADQRVNMSMNLYGSPGEIRRRDVEGYAKKLLASTQAVTRAIGGAPPSALVAAELS
jgi:DNA-binding IclR family transcriptional regulator